MSELPAKVAAAGHADSAARVVLTGASLLHSIHDWACPINGASSLLHEMTKPMTLFRWGYYGWGNSTAQLIEAVDAIEKCHARARLIDESVSQ